MGSRTGAESGVDFVSSLQALKGGGSLPPVPPPSPRVGCLISWGMCQEFYKSPKNQVAQPSHPPPVEGLVKGIIEEIFEGRIIEPKPLCCTTELQGKLPHSSALLTEGAQGLKLEDALVEGAGESGGWRMAQALPLLSPHNGEFDQSGRVEGMRAKTKLQEAKGLY